MNPDEVVAGSSFEKLQNGSKVNIVQQPTGQRSRSSNNRSRKTLRKARNRRRRRLESVSAIYSAAGRDLAAHGRDSCWRASSSYFQLPVSALPQVDYPTIQVLTFYPGASPDVTATTVTAPLERQFGQLQGLSQMTSTSAGGVSVVVLQFVLTLPIDVAEEEVQSAINAAQSLLPSNLPTPPIYSKTNPADAPVLTLAITSDTIPLSKVEDLVDTRLAPKISQLSGVGLVTISGGQKPAVRIQANPDRACVLWH